MDRFARLLMGYEQFRGSLSEDDRSLFQELATGQSPSTLYITCSDSRIDPSLFTKAKPGELFVVRNAGNIVPCCDNATSKADLGTIQFAVEVLKVEHVVVCGHSNCGAVIAMSNPESVRSFPYLEEWIKLSKDGLDLNPNDSVCVNVRKNVLHQVGRLKKLDFVKSRIEDGTLRLHAWVFSIEDASIETYSVDTEQWVSLININESGAEPTPARRQQAN